MKRETIYTLNYFYPYYFLKVQKFYYLTNNNQHKLFPFVYEYFHDSATIHNSFFLSLHGINFRNSQYALFDPCLTPKNPYCFFLSAYVKS